MCSRGLACVYYDYPIAGMDVILEAFKVGEDGVVIDAGDFKEPKNAGGRLLRESTNKETIKPVFTVMAVKNIFAIKDPEYVIMD
jgi:hypothetical protein